MITVTAAGDRPSVEKSVSFLRDVLAREGVA
jgi:hypothetical protein